MSKKSPGVLSITQTYSVYMLEDERKAANIYFLEAANRIYDLKQLISY